MRWVFLLLVGCASADPCAPFPNESCVTLEVRGAPEVARLDQLALSAPFLSDGRTPSPPRAFELPVRVAVLPGAAFAGPFSLDVRGLRDTAERGRDRVEGAIDRPKQHLSLIATLVPEGGGSDGGLDLSSGPPRDLAAPPGSDLAVIPGGWVAEPQVTQRALLAVWSSSPSDIYAVGYQGLILHSTGDGNWEKRQLPGTTSDATSMWGSSATNLFITTLKGDLYQSSDGLTWTLSTATAPNSGFTVQGVWVWGRAADDIYVGGTNPLASTDRLFRFNGTSWDYQQTMYSGSNPRSRGVFASSASDIYIAGGSDGPSRMGLGEVLHSTGDKTWTQATSGSRDFWGIWGSSASDLYAVGTDGSNQPGTGILMHFNGSGWSREGTFSSLTCVWGSGKGDVYVASGAASGIYHSTGNGTWTLEPNTNFVVRSIWGTGAHDVWAVTFGGVILHKK